MYYFRQNSQQPTRECPNKIISNIRTKTRKSKNQMSEPKNQQHFKTPKSKNQMSEPKNQQHFKTRKSKNQMSEPKRPYQYNNLTTCKLCFTNIILHANFKQKPKFVLKKKKKRKKRNLNAPL
jgi:hypothetical protein